MSTAFIACPEPLGYTTSVGIGITTLESIYTELEWKIINWSVYVCTLYKDPW